MTVPCPQCQQPCEPEQLVERDGSVTTFPTLCEPCIRGFWSVLGKANTALERAEAELNRYEFFEMVSRELERQDRIDDERVRRSRAGLE